ncbi:aminotransferase class I/II-fold pyridoxal phosphate-dependent enzyme [Ammoniphilus resinae]|uniref:Aminotransferase n=1 Tax=Ammoniphilus resinae TaxID=861532 RepID=A0ABS4GXC1_9BACL|nr:aminotransferase class I/II-fold pyridoxal phosphate-dependent enzyme [Ammoniphilus resinae]MBP1934752.1 aminotransferase [Ammoniphilus resinae]
MRNRLSKTIQEIPPSGIRKYFDLASTMENVISLGVGEPDFVTPWSIREASISTMERGYTTYTSNSGLPELRYEIGKYLAESFQVHYDDKKEMIITVGASEAIDIALRAILDPGDEVLIIEPCYVSYEPTVKLAGGVPVSVTTDMSTKFKITADILREKITSKSKAIIFCYPNNPTGATMSKEDWLPIIDLIKEHDLLVLSDEIYGELSYDQHHFSAASLPGMKDRTILISGFSKAFAMTGWRIGYACGPEDIIQAMLKIHQYTMLCAPIMGQWAAVEALRNGQKAKDDMVASYRQRRNYVSKMFNQIGLECLVPEGAFYAFPSITATGLTSDQFAEQLIKEAQVAVVPGHVFGIGGEGHIRCSYATSMENLEKAIERMGKFVEQYK